MLLETAEAPVTVTAVIDPTPLKPMAGGPVLVDTSKLPTVILSGGGIGWTTEGGQLTLKPAATQMTPLWYQLTFETDLGSNYTLLGAQLYKVDESDTIVYFPAVNNTVTINVMNNLAPGVMPVGYTFQVGFLKNDGTQIWSKDPTITFDPQT